MTNKLLFKLFLVLLLIEQASLFAQLGDDNLLPEIEIGLKTLATGNFYSTPGSSSLQIPIISEREQVISDFPSSYFDLVAHYRYSQNNGELVTLLGECQHRFQAGLSYVFNKVFNSQFDDRTSILNLEHGYIR